MFFIVDIIPGGFALISSTSVRTAAVSHKVDNNNGKFGLDFHILLFVEGIYTYHSITIPPKVLGSIFGSHFISG